MKKHILLVLAVILVILVRQVDFFKFKDHTNGPKVFDKTTHSLSDPASLWIIVNKKRPLNPPNYEPNDLTMPKVPLRREPSSVEMKVRASAAKAMEELFDSAKHDGLSLALASGYRSYDMQKTTYDTEVIGYGKKFADTESARPGYSEHQTGWAADVGPENGECVVLDCFANTPEGKWLAIHAWQHGFVIRYRQSTKAIVGYKYEPWHIRYVGKELANEIHKTNLTLEQFFDLPAAPNY